MNERQRYLFDLQGYVVVQDVLSADECDVALEKIKTRMKPMGQTPDGKDPGGTWYWVAPNAGLINEGQPFIKLIDEPKITDVLTDIIGPKLRCESCLSLVRCKGSTAFDIHGGHRGGSVNFRYTVQNSRIYTGLCVVAIALQDIGEQDGGFACIPGSHKSEFSVPAADRKEMLSHGGPLVRYIAQPKGSAIVFTETLAHGAGSWQREEPRYGLFYKYNDRAAVFHCQRDRLPNQETLEQMTDAQRCFFNVAWESFGPEGDRTNSRPDF